MTPNEAELIGRYSQAILNVSLECIDGGARPEVVARAISLALSKVLMGFHPPQRAAAWLRLEARKVEVSAPRTDDSASDHELVQLCLSAHEYINTLQIAGISEQEAITALTNACIERVVRMNGAVGAAGWLRRMADLADANVCALEALARAH